MQGQTLIDEEGIAGQLFVSFQTVAFHGLEEGVVPQAINIGFQGTALVTDFSMSLSFQILDSQFHALSIVHTDVGDPGIGNNVVII